MDNINAKENNEQEKTKEELNETQNNEVKEEIKNEQPVSKPKKVMQTISSIIQYIIIFILLAIIVLIIYNRQTNKLEDLFVYKFYTIVSGSMQTEINIGDVVVVKKVENVEVGEVAAYQNGQSVVVHRIIDKQEVNGETLYTAKGDFNNAPDINPIKESQIIGVCKYTIPKIGYIGIFVAQNPATSLGIFIVLVLICILIYVIRKK